MTSGGSFDSDQANGELLILPGLELAVFKRGNTIPDPKLRGREDQTAGKASEDPESRGGRA